MSNEISNAELKKFYAKIRKDRKYLPAFQLLTWNQRQWLRSSYMHYKRLDSQINLLQDRLAGRIHVHHQKANQERTQSFQAKAKKEPAGSFPE